MSRTPQPRADRVPEADERPPADEAAAADQVDPVDQDDPASQAVPAGGPDPAEAGPVVRAADPAAAARRRVALRTLSAALPLGALGSCLVLFGVRATWTRGTADFAQSPLRVHATGSQMTALPGALALVGLAALVAVFAVRRAGRYAVAGLLALSGAGVLAAVINGRSDRGALNSAAASATGLTHATAQHVSTTSWPLVAAAGGLLLLAAGLLALRYGQSWPAMSGRYERGSDRRMPRTRSTGPAPVNLDRSEDVWKALDRGEDPT